MQFSYFGKLSNRENYKFQIMNFTIAAMFRYQKNKYNHENLSGRHNFDRKPPCLSKGTVH